MRKKGKEISSLVNSDQLTDIISSAVIEAMVNKIGESWCTIIADSTLDPTGAENLSVVVHFVSGGTEEVREHMLSIIYVDEGDVESLINTLITNLRKEVHDGVPVLSGKHVGGLKLEEDKSVCTLS